MTLVSPEYIESNPERVEADTGTYYRWREEDGTPMRAPERNGRPDQKKICADAVWTSARGDELAWIEEGAKMKGRLIDLAGETWVVDVTCDGEPAGPRAERRVLDGLTISRNGGVVEASYDGPSGRVSGRLLWNGKIFIDAAPFPDVFPADQNPRPLPLTETYRDAVERRLARVGDEFGVAPAITFDQLVRQSVVAERVLEESRISVMRRPGAMTIAADTLKDGETRRACVRVNLRREAGGVWAVTAATVGPAYNTKDTRRTWCVTVSRDAVAHIPQAVISPRLKTF